MTYCSQSSLGGFSYQPNPIVNIELSGFLIMQGTSFMDDAFKDVVDMVVACSHSIEPVFCGGGGEFVVVIKLYGV